MAGLVPNPTRNRPRPTIFTESAMQVTKTATLPIPQAMRMANLLQGEGPLSLAVLDIDHFKAVNDTYGHAAGDVVLRGVARVLRAGLAAGEWPARVGGEEFAVVLPGAGQEEARTRGEALRRAVAGIDFLAGAEGARFSVTVSLGVAEHRRGEAAEALIARADTALYTAKRRGRDRVVIARDGDD